MVAATRQNLGKIFEEASEIHYILGSCLIFTGNKFTTSECILQNSDGDRSFVELMEVAINKFILIPSLSSYRVLSL